MKTRVSTVFAAIFLVAILVGFTPAASGQGPGAVSFVPMTEGVFHTYLNNTVSGSQMVAWEVLWDIRGNGSVLLMTPTTTNQYQSSMNVASTTDIQVIESSGLVTASSQIVSGLFGTTGDHGSRSIGSASPITGLVIGILNPYSTDGDSQIVTKMFVGPNYWSMFADTTGDDFLGAIGMFEEDTTSLDVSFTLDTPAGSAGQIYILGLTNVPEPSSVVMIGLGLLVVMLGQSLNRRRSA